MFYFKVNTYRCLQQAIFSVCLAKNARGNLIKHNKKKEGKVDGYKSEEKKKLYTVTYS